MSKGCNVKKLPTVYEHYHYDHINGIKVETDLFEFTRELDADGKIIACLHSWKIWSSFVSDWQEQSLRYLEIVWPTKYQKICDEIDELVSQEDFAVNDLPISEAL